MTLWQEMKLTYFGVGALKHWFWTAVGSAAIYVMLVFVMVLGS